MCRQIFFSSSVLFFIYSLSLSHIRIAEGIDLRELQAVQQLLNNEFSLENYWGFPVKGVTYSDLKKRFLDNSFAKYIHNKPIFIYEVVTHSDGCLGNRFGNFFEVQLHRFLIIGC